MISSPVVSTATESLILVDEEDREIGTTTKYACHAGAGILHRAFSIFIFNSRDELLLQKRSPQKPLWPNYWSNTCCSHPRHGETMTQAIKRRLAEELGIRCALNFLYKFKYHAAYESIGSEREYCWVYYGCYDGPLDVNGNEISAWRYVDIETFAAELAGVPDTFTPWLKLEWMEIAACHLDVILRS